jgi:hypothetical protein
MRRIAPAAASLAAGLLLAGGCATMRASRARAEGLRAQLDSHRYQKPLAEVWQEARRLLHDQGYALAAKDLGALGIEAGATGLLTLLTSAKETEPGLGGGLVMESGWGRGIVRKRYKVEGFEDAGGSRVVFTAIPEDLTERGRDGRERARDLEMELALAWRVDPQAAERIEASLEAAGEARPARP